MSPIPNAQPAEPPAGGLPQFAPGTVYVVFNKPAPKTNLVVGWVAWDGRQLSGDFPGMRPDMLQDVLNEPVVDSDAGTGFIDPRREPVAWLNALHTAFNSPYFFAQPAQTA